MMKWFDTIRVIVLIGGPLVFMTISSLNPWAPIAVVVACVLILIALWLIELLKKE